MPRITHGASSRSLKLYRVFNTMRQRCDSEKHPMYHVYGGRGIDVCRDWRENPRKFVEWALANGYKEGLTLDRINADGNYEPSNCRWVTVKEQQRNRRNNRYLTWRGQTKCIGEWAEITGIPEPNIVVRLDRCGMSVDDALTIKPVPRNKRYEFNGEILRAKELAARLGVSPSYVYRRFTSVDAVQC